MRTRLLGIAMALTAVTLTAGCGLTGPEPAEPSERSGQITVGDKTQSTRLVSCSQIQWLMSIEASADPGRARASLELGGDKPIVKTVNIQNIDGLQGVVGGDVGTAEATFRDDTYVITGTAVGSDPANPGQTRKLPFTIEAPC